MNKKVVIYNLINSGIAGTLVFAGSMASGNLTKEGLCVSIGTAFLVFLTKFRDFWVTNETRINGVFNFI